MNNDRPWYKKTRYLLPIGALVAALSVSALDGGTTTTPATTYTPPPIQAAPVTEQEKVISEDLEIAPTVSEKEVPLSNDNYYTNSAGNSVHSPAYAPEVPPGASAQCRDGTYSFSQSRHGTCSHHGGVARWL